jgi:hypothetical protein
LKAVTCAIPEVNNSSRLCAQAQAEAQAEASPQAVTGDIIASMNKLPGKSIMMSTPS